MSFSFVELTVTVTKAPAPSLLQRTMLIVDNGASSVPNGDALYIADSSEVDDLLTGDSETKDKLFLYFRNTTNGVYLYQAGAAAPAIIIVDDGTFINTPVAVLQPVTINTYAQYMTSASPNDVKDQLDLYFQSNPLATVYLWNDDGDAVTNPPPTPPTDYKSVIDAFAVWLRQNKQTYYAVVTPQAWYSEPSFIDLATSYNQTTDMQYFVVGQNDPQFGTWSSYRDSKGVISMQQTDPTVYAAASLLGVLSKYNPSAVVQMKPLHAQYIEGLPSQYQRVQPDLHAENINYVGRMPVGSGYRQVVWNGVNADGFEFNKWYGIDWVVIQVPTAVNSLMVQAANSSTPIGYNQNGIDTIKAVIIGVMEVAVSQGIIELFRVSAIPYREYAPANPVDLGAGIYNGFTIDVQNKSFFKKLGIAANFTEFLSLVEA